MVCERLLSDCTLKAFAFSGSRTSVNDRRTPSDWRTDNVALTLHFRPETPAPVWRFRANQGRDYVARLARAGCLVGARYGHEQASDFGLTSSDFA